MKKVLVTGGSSGIGKAICELLQRKGYQVFGTSRNPERHSNSNFPLISLDVTSNESVDSLMSKVQEKMGGLDVLINNAGIGFMGPLELAKPEDIKLAWETNVFGSMQVTQKLLPLLKNSQDARILNIGSIGGRVGLPYRGWYSAAKSSLEILGETLSLELKPFNIQVCTLLPGDVKTPIGESRLEPNSSSLGDYKESYSKMKQILEKEMDSAISPDTVASTIHRLLNKKSMPLKHVVGSFLHKATPIIKNLLPQKWFQWLILRHYS